jgi:hypothetical protein
MSAHEEGMVLDWLCQPALQIGNSAVDPCSNASRLLYWDVARIVAEQYAMIYSIYIC